VLGGAAADEVTERGPCPGHAGQVRVDGTAGAVCVDAAALDRVVEAARAAAAGPAAIDPSPLDHRRLARLSWPLTGAVVEVAGGGFTLSAPAATAGPAGDDAVRAAVAALTEPGRVVAMPRRAHLPRAAAGPALIARYADGGEDRLTVVFVPGVGVALRRGDEPFAIAVAPAALAAVGLGPDDLRDRALVVEEPTGLTELVATAGGKTARAGRGAVLGEWQGDLDPARVSAAAATIADLRAARFVTGGVGPVRVTLEATFAAPPVAGGAPSHYTITIGAARPGGCAATVDGTAVVLDAARCRTLLALRP
jgi:hypothetical protein